MSEALVQLGRDLDDSHLARIGFFGPAQSLDESRAVGWRVPLHKDKLSAEAMTFTLADQGVDKRLHSPQQALAVIIVPRRDHYGQIRIGVSHSKPPSFGLCRVSPTCR